MTARSHRLLYPTKITSTAPELIYTAPAGRVVLAKNLRVVNVTADPVRFYVTLNGTSDGDALFWYQEVPRHVLLWDTSWEVLEPEDELWFRAETADALVVSMSGALLIP